MTVETHREGLGGEEQLDQVLLEEQLDHLLEHGQQPRVVHGHAALQQRQQALHLRQRLVVVAQHVDGRREDLADHLPLLGRVELERAHLPRQSLAALLAWRLKGAASSALGRPEAGCWPPRASKPPRRRSGVRRRAPSCSTAQGGEWGVLRVGGPVHPLFLPKAKTISGE
jgi:hypothetical protein